VFKCAEMKHSVVEIVLTRIRNMIRIYTFSVCTSVFFILCLMLRCEIIGSRLGKRTAKKKKRFKK